MLASSASNMGIFSNTLRYGTEVEFEEVVEFEGDVEFEVESESVPLTTERKICVALAPEAFRMNGLSDPATSSPNAGDSDREAIVCPTVDPKTELCGQGCEHYQLN